jgi:iron complex outermembrane receptor protein
MNIRRSTLVATAVAAALYGQQQPAHAQAAAGDADDAMEEIVVRGIRGSMQQALDIKRNATGMVDAITAEDVGKFPDKNLAEALQRVPGIVINREFGEGERVSLRGTGTNLTRTLLNGHGLATADWFILDQQAATRSFNYLMLPTDIIGKVTVHKSSRADLDEGGIGGVVDVETRKPLDLPSMTAFGSFTGAWSELSDEFDPQASALFSWKNSDETLGVLVAGLRQERNIRRDGVEVLGYFEADSASGPVIAPALIGSALFQQERVRTGGNVTLQYRPNDRLTLDLTGLVSEFDADNINQNYMAWGVRALGNGGTLTNETVVGDTAVSGRISSLNNGTSDFGVVYDAIDRFATAQTRSIDLDAIIDLNDDWTLHFDVGYTDAEGNTENQPFVEFGAPAVFDYDLTGRAPQVTYQNVEPTDPADMQFIFSSLHEILNDDDETYFYADAERRLGRGVWKSLKFGAKYSDHNRDVVFNATTYGGFHVPINTLPSTAFAGGMTPGDFLDNIASPGTLDQYWQVDQAAVEQILFDNLASGAGRVVYPQQNFSVTEEALAGYVMAELESDRWRGDVGVRVVRTDQTSRGNLIDPVLGEIENPFGNFTPLTVERDYTDVLPSATFAYDLTEEIVVRAAAAQVMARPDYTDIAPRTSLNPGALSGSAGNPDVDPYRANQVDLSVEYYPEAGAGYALAVYYKDIESFITDQPVIQNFPVQSATSPSLACTPTGTDTFDCPFTINLRSNGGGGRIQGFELAATQPLFGGFGFQTNYTFADAEADNGDPLPQASRDQFNLTGYFENERLSTRVSYTYRSDFFVTFDRTTPLNQESLRSLDAALSYSLTDNVTLTFDGINLTNEEIVQFAGDRFRPRAIYDNGRVYFFGVRVAFNQR